MDVGGGSVVDFFISYTGVDVRWARWIAVELERAGYSTVLQDFDFQAGSDFVHKMQNAMAAAERTIAALSPAYLGSQFAEAEWREAFARDPSGELGLLVPVRVQLCNPPGLLATRVYVDLVGLEEDAAREELLRRVSRQTPRPTHAPFPGGADRLPTLAGEVEFPGADPAATDLKLHAPGASDAGDGAAALSAVVHILRPDTYPDLGFVGRVDEQAGLLPLLAPSENEGSDGSAEPVVALSAVAGLGGIGKSALARAVAQTAAARGWFPGGVIWVDLHGFHPGVVAQIRPAQLWPRLLGALGVAEDSVPPAEAARAGLYHALLDQFAVDGRRVLLVFDNVAAADQVAPLLPMAGSAATRHRILLTSRQTLAELPARLVNLDVLDTAAATQLLTHTLTVRTADEHRHTDNPDGFHRLVGLCAGLPLAIVVVGAILAAEPTLSVAELADELEDTGGRLSGLTYSPGLAVKTAFEVSYHRLADDDRTVFAGFSVIPGPDAALPMITAAAGLSQPQTRAAVRHLEIVHLLEPVLTSRGTRRWRMHDLVRLYAREQLDAQAASAAAEGALTYYQDMLDAAWKRIAKNEDGTGEGTFPTHRAAVKWFQDEQAGLVDAVVRSTADHARQAVLLAADLMPCLHRVHAVDSALRVGEAAVRLATDVSMPEQILARAYGNLGMALSAAERFDDAITALDRAGALSQHAGDTHAAAVTRMNLGVLFGDLHRYTEARTVLADASTTFHDLGDKTNEASALLNMGNTLLGDGALTDALSTFDSARRLFEELHDPHGRGLTWAVIGSVHRARTAWPEAIDAYRQACAALEDAVDPYNGARAHDHLGDALAGVGQASEATTAYTRSADLYVTAGDHDSANRQRAKAAFITHG